MSSQKIEAVAHSLELDEDLKLFRRGKRVQHVGWMVMLVMLILSGIGLFGSGWVSYKTQVGSKAKVEYERFLRFEHELPFTITARGEGGKVLVSFPTKYFESFRVEQINPMPMAMQHQSGQVLYTFYADDTHEASIRFYFTPEGEGSVKGSVTVNGESFNLAHFIYP